MTNLSREQPSGKKYRRLTAAVFEEHMELSLWGKRLNAFILTLIVLNVTAVVVESVESIRAAYSEWFWWFEVFSVIIFSIEYILRVWSSPEFTRYRSLSKSRARWRYMRSPMALIDLLAIAPFWLHMFFPFDMRFLRALRLLRILKATRHSRAMQLMIDVFRQEGSNLVAAFAVLFVLLVLASSGIYFIESEVQPDKFGSIPAAMWWAMATLTTVGYGDVTPITAGGKFFGGFITIIGIGMVALPAGILSSGYSAQLSRRREQFQVVVHELLADGELDENDHELIEELREALQLDAATARKIVARVCEKRRRK